MMSFVVFGALILFAIYAMAHFMHEWLDARKERASHHSQDTEDASDQT